MQSPRIQIEREPLDSSSDSSELGDPSDWSRKMASAHSIPDTEADEVNKRGTVFESAMGEPLEVPERRCHAPLQTTSSLPGSSRGPAPPPDMEEIE